MRDIGEALVERAKNFHHRTGEKSVMVVIENRDSQMAVHSIGYDPALGLLVDGFPPSLQFYQEAEDFHPLQWAPEVLH